MIDATPTTATIENMEAIANAIAKTIQDKGCTALITKDERFGEVSFWIEADGVPRRRDGVRAEVRADSTRGEWRNRKTGKVRTDVRSWSDKTFFRRPKVWSEDYVEAVAEEFVRRCNFAIAKDAREGKKEEAKETVDRLLTPVMKNVFGVDVNKYGSTTGTIEDGVERPVEWEVSPNKSRGDYETPGRVTVSLSWEFDLNDPDNVEPLLRLLNGIAKGKYDLPELNPPF